MSVPLKKRRIFILWSFFYLVLHLALSPSTSAFAFRTLEVGVKAPEIRLNDVEGKEFVLSSIKDKKVVLLFWGTDTPIKEKRSLSVMGRLENLYRMLKGEGLEVICINSDPDGREKAKALRPQKGWPFSILLDEKREVYGVYGVYILPTVGILDEEKRVMRSLPYTHSLDEDVVGEVLVALGKKTAEEWEKEKRPKEKLLPEHKRKAQSHYSLGKSFLEKGSIEKAKEEFKKAIEIDRDHSDAYIGLGRISLKGKQTEEALQFFERGLVLNPHSRQGYIGLALTFEAMGENAKAIEKLEGLVKERVELPEIHYHLGRLYEKEGQKDRALSEYKKALRFVFKEE